MNFDLYFPGATVSKVEESIDATTKSFVRVQDVIILENREEYF